MDLIKRLSRVILFFIGLLSIGTTISLFKQNDIGPIVFVNLMVCSFTTINISRKV